MIGTTPLRVIIILRHSISSDDKAVSEMKIADEQPQRPVTRMFAKEGEDHLRHEAAIRRINSQLLDPVASPPFICDLCSVAFLTKRELQLHVMCHGIHIAGNVGGEKVHAVVQVSGEARQTNEGNYIVLHSCFARYSGFIKINAKPSRIAFTTQCFDTLVSSSGMI